MELTSKIVKYIKMTQFEDIPQSSIFAAKQLILDSLGVAIAGSTAEGVKEIVELIKEWGGIPQSTVFCYGFRLPAINVAFANSVMIHARDFDDTHDGAVVHTSVTILPTVLALAEKRGMVSGKDFLTAFILGIDLNARLGLAISHAQDFYAHETRWVRTATCGIFGATASACKIERMTETEIINALGISLSQVAGTRQVVSDSALTKRIQPAFMTRSAILSTFLAQKGIIGCKEVFEGRYGYFNLYWNGSYDPEVLIDGLGKRFEIEEVSLKPYPCCRYTHGAIDATIKCTTKYNISPDNIEEVNIHLVKHPFFDLVSRPFSIRGNPTIDAQFSIPYTVTSAIIDKFISLETFEPMLIKERSKHPLLKRIRVWIDREVKTPDSLGPVTVDVKTKSGEKYSETIEEVKGHPRNRMTNEECLEKFIRCAAYSLKPVSKKNLDKIVQMIFQLEQLGTINEFVYLLKTI
jgi:2-methylcitrate dehydratase PrpD